MVGRLNGASVEIYWIRDCYLVIKGWCGWQLSILNLEEGHSFNMDINSLHPEFIGLDRLEMSWIIELLSLRRGCVKKKGKSTPTDCSLHRSMFYCGWISPGQLQNKGHLRRSVTFRLIGAFV